MSSSQAVTRANDSQVAIICPVAVGCGDHSVAARVGGRPRISVRETGNYPRACSNWLPHSRASRKRGSLAAYAARLLATLIIRPARDTWYRCPGQHGDAATNTAHEPATAGGKPANHEHCDLRLEY
jgi:hypothetical protein